MMLDVERSYRITTGIGLRLYIVVVGAIWIGILIQVVLDATSPARYLPLILILVGCLWLSRIFRLVVEVIPDGIVVRNLFRTIRLPWERIDGFRVQRGQFGSPLGRTVSLLLDGGDAITLDATMRSWGFTGGHQQVREMAARLQASLEEAHRERPSSTVDPPGRIDLP
jgi:hypothetical protein